LVESTAIVRQSQRTSASYFLDATVFFVEADFALVVGFFALDDLLETVGLFVDTRDFPAWAATDFDFDDLLFDATERRGLRIGLFQSTARSARNFAGINIGPSA
jgi:hypothetical protein